MQDCGWWGPSDQHSAIQHFPMASRLPYSVRAEIRAADGLSLSKQKIWSATPRQNFVAGVKSLTVF
jgi:hypothetical protein